MAHFHSHNNTEHSVNAPVMILYLCLAINLIFVAAEAFASWKSNLTGLLSDVGHNLSDALVSVSVVISGIIMSTTGWTIIDPLRDERNLSGMYH